MSRSCVAEGFDILDNRRTVGLLIMKAIMSPGRHEPEYTLAGTGYGCGSLLEKAKLVKLRDVRFPWSHNNDPDAFHSVKVLP